MAGKIDLAPKDIHAADPKEAAAADRKTHDDLKAGLIGSFPASDPPSATQSSPTKHDRKQNSSLWQKIVSAFRG